MKKFEIKLTDLEVKAMEFDVANVQAWIENAVYNKVRHNIDLIVLHFSDKQCSKISDAEKVNIVAEADFTSAKERNKKFMST